MQRGSDGVVKRKKKKTETHCAMRPPAVAAEADKLTRWSETERRRRVCARVHISHNIFLKYFCPKSTER